MKLQQYDFEIKHRPGKLNANADALSRINNDQKYEDNTREVFMVTTVEIEESEEEWHISYDHNSAKNSEETWFENQLFQQFSNVPMITTVGYESPKDEMEEIYNENIKIKSVITN